MPNFISRQGITCALLVLLTAVSARAERWQSITLGSDLALQIRALGPPEKNKLKPLVIYLSNLATPRVGTESDESILADFQAAGYLVAVLDYDHDPKARMPGLAHDLVALRSQLQHKTFLNDQPIDSGQVFIIPAGCRLKRDVIFYREPGRVLAMDIIYPANPPQPVGTVLEFSCDNADRMSNSSLDFCTDTLLPGAATEGFAAAMADHPVGAPYQGFDAMPDSAWKIKAAIRTLRAEGTSLGLNDRIVTAGFSRGSGMALMSVTTAGLAEFDHHGEHLEADSTVQGAVVMSGRFTYLDLLPGDKMIPRYEKNWGARSDHESVWRSHGAVDYLNKAAAVPLFLTINASESPDALHQMDVVRRRLIELHSAFAYHPEPEPRGHKMPLDPRVLDPLFNYLHGRLDVAPRAGVASP